MGRPAPEFRPAKIEQNSIPTTEEATAAKKVAADALYDALFGYFFDEGFLDGVCATLVAMHYVQSFPYLSFEEIQAMFLDVWTRAEAIEGKSPAKMSTIPQRRRAHREHPERFPRDASGRFTKNLTIDK